MISLKKTSFLAWEEMAKDEDRYFGSSMAEAADKVIDLVYSILSKKETDPNCAKVAHEFASEWAMTYKEQVHLEAAITYLNQKGTPLADIKEFLDDVFDNVVSDNLKEN